jgi:hypothetical protein
VRCMIYLLVCVNLKNYYIVLRYYDRTTQASIYVFVYTLWGGLLSMYSTPHSSLLHVWLACRFLSLLLHFFPSHSHSLLLTHSLTHSVRSPSSLCIHSAPIHPPHTPFSVSIFSLTHTLTHSHTHTYTYTHTLTFAHTYTHSLLLTHYQWTASST